MNPVTNTEGFDKYNTHVFEYTLDRQPKAELWKLEKNEATGELQRLFNLATQNKDNKPLCSKYINEYQAKLDELQSTGKREFTLTKGIVSELVEDSEHKTMNVPIKIQIKEGVLTWYFVAPMDQTKQSFRDEVFLAAGLAQVTVDHSRFRYLRGTNSLHVKKMHTKEAESLMNHNHYILDKGEDFDPDRVKQHLDGFVQAERELAAAGYIKTESSEVGKEKFLTQAEADAIVKKYKEHWEKINERFDKKISKINPKTKESTEESIKTSQLQEKKELGQRRLTREDKNEWVKYNYEFNTVVASGLRKLESSEVVPLDLIPEKNRDKEDKEVTKESTTYISQQSHFTIDPAWPLKQRIEAVKKAMRGGYSHRAQVRQMEGSELPPLAEITKMNDAVKIDQKKQPSNKT